MNHRMFIGMLIGLAVWAENGIAASSTNAPARSVAFVLRRPAAPRPISPLIYGLAAAPEALLRDWRIPVNRWGGNTADRYNWKLGNAWNTGNDWFFRNVAVEPDAWRGFLQHSKNTQGTAILTVPLVGYVAKDTTSYSYALGKYGKQAASEPGNPDIGNGRLPGGRLLYGNDPTDANRKADPEFVVEWLTEVRKGFPELVGERRLIVTLGNEPMLWNKTHRDVHP
ncbi:MAG: glycoside hydrolase family 44 protein, partial [bacterium]